MTTEPKIIAVTGATGGQGGGLVRAMLERPELGFVPRAITRDPASPAAQALAAQGVEVVQADACRRLSLVRAFAGAHGAFCMTSHWEHLSPEVELVQAANLAAAAKLAGVRHVVWSTHEDVRWFVPLEDTRMPTLLGQYRVPHLDAKGVANAFFRAAGVPTTLLIPAFFWEHLITFGLGPRASADLQMELALPLGDAPLPGIAAADAGAAALGVFAEGERWLGRAVGVAGEHRTGAELAAALGRALGHEVRYVPQEPDAFRAGGVPGADDFGNMFQFYAEFAAACCAVRDVATTRVLHPGVRTFAGWLDEHAPRIPIDLDRVLVAA